MTPIGHLAIGFAAKPAGPKIHLGVLLAASWLLDFLYFIFAFAGLESTQNLTNPGSVPSPYSHSLFMALIWSSLAGLLAWRGYHSRRAGLVVGLVAFSHWVLDFISWNNLFLFFDGSPKVGLGLFNAMGAGTLYIEIGLFLAGIVIFLAFPPKRSAHNGR